MVSEMFDKAIQFLKDHKEIALATCEGNLPKLRIFQIMKQEGHVLYFATSAQKAVYRELRQNPNVEILAYADNISVRCSGMVNFNVEDDVKGWIYIRWRRRPREFTPRSFRTIRTTAQIPVPTHTMLLGWRLVPRLTWDFLDLTRLNPTDGWGANETPLVASAVWPMAESRLWYEAHGQ